jgi:two-component sensor histidine kinase
LCNDIRDSLIQDKEVQLLIETEEIYLSIEKAIPAGLIVNEIITNSIKHAFKDSTSGKIDLRLSKHTHSVYLLIHDNGIGIDPVPKGSNEESLGFMLVDSLVNQLDGTYEFVNHNGTSFVLRFPI